MTFDPERYSNVHRRYVQMLTAKGVVRVEESYDMFRKALAFEGYEPTQANFAPKLHAMWAKIDSELEFMRCSVKEFTSEIDNRTSYVALICTLNEPFTRSAGHWTKPEMQIMAKLVEMICEADEGSVSRHDVIKECVQMTEVKSGTCEALLDKLIKNKWLVESANERVDLHPRAVAELSNLLRQNYDPPESAPECSLCKQIVINKEMARCTCCEDNYVHAYCMKKYVQARGGLPPQCTAPRCRAPWTQPLPQDY